MLTNLGTSIVTALIEFLVGALFAPITQLASDFLGLSGTS